MIPYSRSSHKWALETPMPFPHLNTIQCIVYNHLYRDVAAKYRNCISKRNIRYDEVPRALKPPFLYTRSNYKNQPSFIDKNPISHKCNYSKSGVKVQGTIYYINILLP